MTAVNIVVSALWLSLIAYLLWRLRDIKKNPKKYDAIPGYEKFLHSPWYWDPKKEFSRLDPPPGSRFAGAECFLLTLALFGALPYLLEDICPIKGFFFTFSAPAFFLFMITAALMAAVMSFFAPLHIKTPRYICFNLHYVFKGKPRSFAWKRLTGLALCAALVSFPLYMLSINSFLVADEEKMTYSRFFPPHQCVMRYEDITDAKLSYAKNGEPESCVFVSEDGSTFPIYVDDHPEEIERILSMIDKK